MERTIAKGRMARIEGKGTLLRVMDGALWVTQEGDLRDYFIRPGGFFRVDRAGVTLAYALQDARFSLGAPAPTKSGWLARLYSPLSRPTTAAL